MIAGGFFWHLLRTLRRSFGRIFLLFFVTGLIAAIVVELAAIIVTGGQFPSPWTHITAAILFFVVGYGVSITMLTAEIIRDLVTTVEDMAKDVRNELTASGKVVTDFARSYEQRRA
jgi:hypothetical protein